MALWVELSKNIKIKLKARVGAIECESNKTEVANEYEIKWNYHRYSPSGA